MGQGKMGDQFARGEFDPASPLSANGYGLRIGRKLLEQKGWLPHGGVNNIKVRAVAPTSDGRFYFPRRSVEHFLTEPNKRDRGFTFTDDCQYKRILPLGVWMVRIEQQTSGLLGAYYLFTALRQLSGWGSLLWRPLRNCHTDHKQNFRVSRTVGARRRVPGYRNEPKP